MESINQLKSRSYRRSEDIACIAAVKNAFTV